MWVQGQRQQLEDAAVGRIQQVISQEVEARRKQLQVPSLPGTISAPDVCVSSVHRPLALTLVITLVN